MVLPISFFEKANNAFFNSIAILDADGRNLGVYRKAHIPNGPGYQEKNYFSPGDTGFKVWDTRFARIGVGICWDQWFPETARAMALHGRGAAVLPDGHRQRAAAGAAREFARPLAAHAAGSRGRESHAGDRVEPHRHGARAAGSGRSVHPVLRIESSSPMPPGAKVAEADEEHEAVLTAKFDLAAIEELRNNWFVFRDRRPELYGALLTLDGASHAAYRRCEDTVRLPGEHLPFAHGGRRGAAAGAPRGERTSSLEFDSAGTAGLPHRRSPDPRSLPARRWRAATTFVAARPPTATQRLPAIRPAAGHGRREPAEHARIAPQGHADRATVPRLCARRGRRACPIPTTGMRQASNG